MMRHWIYVACAGWFGAAAVASGGSTAGVLTVPIGFEANRGQFDSAAAFVARSGSGRVYLAPGQVIMANGGPGGVPLRMRWVGGRAVRAEPRGAQNARAHYFLGNQPEAWITDVPLYERVIYRGVYAGVDLIFHGSNRALEFDFVAGPGAEVEAIDLEFDGADHASLAANGDLVFGFPGAAITLQRPIARQERAGINRPVGVAYELLPQINGTRNVRVRLKVGTYDRTESLIIDPVIVFSTYLGGTRSDDANRVAVDPAGNSYVVGYTDSADFPMLRPFQSQFEGESGVGDIFVSKFGPTGQLLYSSYLGGSGAEFEARVAVDSAGAIYITGYTGSLNYPVRNPFQRNSRGGQEIFLTKLNAAGSALVYSTYYGGTGHDAAFGIAVDAAGSAYLCGATLSTDLPVRNPIQARNGGFADCLVAKFNASGSALSYASYLGGTNDDYAFDLALDASGAIHLVGRTESTNFPVSTNAFQPVFGGVSDAFVARLNPQGTAVTFASHLGGISFDSGVSLALSPAGDIFLTGHTFSTNFPVTFTSAQTELSGTNDAFATKLRSTGALVYSTYVGGSGLESGAAVAVDTNGIAYVTGSTDSTNLVVVNGLQSEFAGGVTDVYLAALNPEGTGWLFSTYLGGSNSVDVPTDLAVHRTNLFLVGRSTPASTNSTAGAAGFPIANAFQSEARGQVPAAGGPLPVEAFVLNLTDILQPVPLPELAARHTGTGEVELSWAANTTGFQLQSAPALAPAAWTTLGGTASPSNGRYRTTNAADTTMQYFRLVR